VPYKQVKGLTVEFTYDAFSRRIGKKVSELSYGQPGAPTLVSWEAYVYDGWNMIGTYSRHLSGSTAGKGKERLATHVWGPDLGSRLEARRDWQAAGGVGGLLMTLYPMPSVNVPTYIEWLAGQGVYETTQIGYEDGNGGWVPYYGEYTGPFYDENNNWISEYGGYDSPYGFLTYSMATAYSLDYGYYAALYEVNHRLHVPVMDHMGNVTSVVRLLGSPGSGSSAQTEFLYDYDAFGKELRASALIAGSNPDSDPFRFSTKFTDPETGLVYYGYRFYDPATGRWINRDPIGENGGLNIYGMMENDAVNYYDVLGLSPRQEYNSPEEAIKKCGEKAKEHAEKTCKSRKDSNKKAEEEAKKKKKMTPRLPSTSENEWGGQVCKSKNSTPDQPKFYCTEMKEGAPAGLDPGQTTPCDKDDNYEGFYHTHPPGTGTSPQDQRLSVNGWGKTVTEAKQRRGKPVGATRRQNGVLRTDIFPYPRDLVTF
jgi:RHS repeat-associated protein